MKKEKTQKNKNIKQTRVKEILLGASAMAAGALITANVYGKTVKWPAYEVVEVLDGDTFITKEDQAIRLMSVDAPEMGRCGSDESRETLKELVMGKPLYIKVVYRDKYNRLIGYVYSGDVFINEEMLKRGMADYQAMTKNPMPSLQQAREKARMEEIGIHSMKCTQLVNEVNPKCVIKGNNSGGNGKKLYRFPGCGQYNQTIVQFYQGDAWFCSEKEAIENGFDKGSDCFGKTSNIF